MTYLLVWGKTKQNKTNKQKTLTLLFFFFFLLGHCYNEILKTLHDYNLSRVYIFIVDMMTLTLFQGHRCARNVHCFLTRMKIVILCNNQCQAGRTAGLPISVCGKSFKLRFSWTYINDKCLTLYDGNTHSARSIPTTFSDLDCI